MKYKRTKRKGNREKESECKRERTIEERIVPVT